MNLRELFKLCTKKLNNAGIEASTHEAGVILCHILNVDKAYLYAHPEKQPDEESIEKVLTLIDKRSERIPLQQLLGCQEFMSLPFKIDENVLIPRQDTEILVETVIQHVANSKEKVEILDVGTGSGCIAVSLAKYIKNSRLTAVDISVTGLSIAIGNAVLNGVEREVDFIKSDLFSAIPEEKRFDVIVSNPPYIPTGDIKSLEPEVRDNEPLLALDGGTDGLYFYRRITEDAIKHLKNNGLIAFEVGIYQAHDVEKILREYSYTDIRIIKDLSGIDRVVCGTLIPSISL